MLLCKVQNITSGDTNNGLPTLCLEIDPWSFCFKHSDTIPKKYRDVRVGKHLKDSFLLNIVLRQHELSCYCKLTSYHEVARE